MKTVECAKCGMEFALSPGKPGKINECPECSLERDPAGNFIPAYPEQAVAAGDEADSRIDVMDRFWKNPSNQEMYRVHKYLATVTKTGKTLAARLVDGEVFKLPYITVRGRKLPLTPGFELSLRRSDLWSCPACHSAHGLRDGGDAELLEKNEWYYNARRKSLLVISKTCYEQYVRELGAERYFFEVTNDKPALRE